MKSLIELDRKLFVYLNNLQVDWLNPVMVLISNKYFWFPFYAFLLFLAIRFLKKKTYVLLPSIALMIVSADQLSQAFKYGFKRWRPCRDEAGLGDQVSLVADGCSQFGYFSAHASNSFAIAMFFGLILSKKYPKLKYILLLWAGVVSYSRIYLGVHYPADVFTGAFFGVLIGWVWFKIFNAVASKLS